MEVQLRALNGQIFKIPIEPDDTIKNLKRKIEEMEGIPMGQLDLQFEGTLLDDSKTLNDYQIRNDYTVDFMVNLKGG